MADRLAVAVRKKLPSRGTLSPSKSEAAAFYATTWIAMNALLFVVPTLSVLSLLVLVESGKLLKLLHIGSAIYYSIYFGIASLVIGNIVFPSFFRYHLIWSLFTRIPRHRSHWTFISERRWRQKFPAPFFTIFVTGLAMWSIPVLVTRFSSMNKVHQSLQDRGFLGEGSRSYYFITPGARPQRISWNSNMSELGLGPMSHVRFVLPYLGGADNNDESGGSNPAGGSSASSSIPIRQSIRTRDTERLAKIFRDEAAEDSDPELRKNRKRKRRASKKKGSNGIILSDNEDETYSLASGESSSDGETSDSEKEHEISNDELADSLTAKTIPQHHSKKGKGKAKEKPNTRPATSSKPARKKSRQQGSDEHNPTQNSDGQIASTQAGPSTSTNVRSLAMGKGRTNPIYLFYEEVERNANGSIEDGATYWKCYHGNRKVLKITKKMRNNVQGLVGHLQRTFPALHRLFQVLNDRKSPPTDEELDIASGKKAMDQDAAKRYLDKLEAIQGNLKRMLEEQCARSQEPWNQNHFEELVAKWVAACDQPFSAVDEPEFREMLEYVHYLSGRKLDIPHDQSVRRRIMDMRDTMVDGYKKLFADNTSNYTLSLDAWTSSNGYAFMAIVIHYISNTGRLEECLIDFRQLIGQHTGENMANAVWETLEQYGLAGRIVAFMMDNATNNDTLVDHFAKRCEKKGISFSTKDARMRCMPHTIHLAAIQASSPLLETVGALTKEQSAKAMNSLMSAYQDSATESLDRSTDDNAALLDDDSVTLEDESATSAEAQAAKSSDIGLAVWKLRKIVRHVRSSPQRRENWQKEVASHHAKAESRMVQGWMLILDVRTRWSSTHQMLRRAFDHQTVIETYVAKDKDLRKYELTESDWGALRQVMDWLKAFRSATTQMSTTKKPMLSSTHAIFRGLQESLRTAIKDLPRSTDPALKAGLAAAHVKLSDYFTKFDESNYYTWAALLDPRISYESLKDDYAEDPDLLGGLEVAKSALETHFLINYQTFAPSGDTTDKNTTLDNQRSPQKINFTSRYGKKKTSANERDELKEYFHLTTVAENFDTTDPIQWWHTRREQFPSLYRLVRDILCIPGSAVAVERVFSGGRDTVGLRRASLKAETIRTLMMVKARLRLARNAVIDLLGEE